MHLTVKFEFWDGLQMGRNRKDLLDFFFFSQALGFKKKKKKGGGVGRLLCIAINT